MNEEQLVKTIGDNMVLLDIPDSLQTDIVTDKLSGIHQITKVQVISRYSKIAASFILVLTGLITFGKWSQNKSSMDMGIVNEVEQKAEITEEESIANYEVKEEINDVYDAAIDEEVPAFAPTEGTSSYSSYNDEIEIIYIKLGEEYSYKIDSSFGNNTEICYYGIDGETYGVSDAEALLITLISDETGNYIKIDAVKCGRFIVQISNGESTYDIKVVVSEE